MKILLSFFSLFFLHDSCYCQLKQVAVSNIVYLEEKGLCCLDSTNIVSTFCPLNLDGFKIKFYAINLDKDKGKLQLIGRVCVSDEINSSGLLGIEIFKAKKVENKLTGRASVGETTDGKKFISNDGFFDIILKVESNESLFFYRTGYFLKEFSVFKLLQ